jgi:hypothetical protein
MNRPSQRPFRPPDPLGATVERDDLKPGPSDVSRK